MTVLEDAKIHLLKAREFLDAADVDSSHELYNAAISNAVISGINSMGAICLTLVRTTTKSANHTNAVGELEAAGAMTKHAGNTNRLAGIFERLLRIKNRAQYEPHRFTHDDATMSIDQAQQLLDGALTIVN
jgi:uncharacterized protein (UPF0332 family)